MRFDPIGHWTAGGWRTARVTYQCGCGVMVRPGDEYYDTREGDGRKLHYRSTVKYCKACAERRRANCPIGRAGMKFEASPFYAVPKAVQLFGPHHHGDSRGPAMTYTLQVQIDLHANEKRLAPHRLAAAVARVLDWACENDIEGAEVLDGRIGQITVDVASGALLQREVVRR